MNNSLLKPLLLVVLSVNSFTIFAGNKIKVYFNRAVDNSVSTGVNAVYLDSCMADTLVAYINRAHYSIDIAQYDYSQGTYANIATAVNNAYTHGVQVRWIFDSSSSNTGITLLNPGIHTLGRPNAGGIMHNKFVIIDANSTNPSDAVVFTGSFDWSAQQFNSDYNNALFIQDSALAHAYTDEFNMMWGSTSLVPNAALAKFGTHKTDLGRHSFTIEGKNVELYFSPSDGTNTHIQSSILSANNDLYFGMYAFTDTSDANRIIARHAAGVYVAGIDDNFSNSYAPYTLFTSALGSNFKAFNLSYIYHNKFLIVDPSNRCSDPLVLTGSHNWSNAANTQNDENTLIIHDDTVANIYYQAFHANFYLLGGTLSSVADCTLPVGPVHATQSNAIIYPTPSNGNFAIAYDLASEQKVRIDVFNLLGQKIATLANNNLEAEGHHELSCNFSIPGTFIVHFVMGDNSYTKQFVVTP